MSINLSFKTRLLSKIYPYFLSDNIYFDQSITHHIKLIICKLIKILLCGKSTDPIVKVFCCGNWLSMPFTHALPQIKAKYPNYDSALPEFCSKVKKSIEENLLIIDVGVNIGDTITQINTKVSSLKALCIEPSEMYYKLLQLNTSKLENVLCLNAFISDEEKKSLNLVEDRGTGISSMVEQTRNCIPNYTLDFIINTQFQDFKNANILKIDTDGWELQILNGGSQFLKHTNAFIFFEFSPYLYCKVNKNRTCEDVLKFLKKMNYESFIVYDGEGYLLGYFDLNHSNTFTILNFIFEYGKIRSSFYCDILASHIAKKHFLKEFYHEELKRLT